MLIDLTDAVQRGVIATLWANGGPGCPVYEHVPTNATAPLVRIDDIITENIGTKDRAAERLTITVVVEYSGRSPTAMRGFAAAVRQRLDDARLQIVGGSASPLRWIDTSDGGLGDGVNYNMRLRYETLAQPN